MAKRGRKKREPLTEEELAQRKERYNLNRKMRRHEQAAELRRERQEWEEFGRIVRKMNKEAGMSRESIWQLLGGLVTRKQITKWCGQKPHSW